MKRDWLAVTIIFWSLSLVAIGYMLALTGSQHPLASGLLWALIILTVIHGIRLAKIDRFLKRRLDKHCPRAQPLTERTRRPATQQFADPVPRPVSA